MSPSEPYLGVKAYGGPQAPAPAVPSPAAGVGARLHDPVLVLRRQAYARSRVPWLRERRRGIGASDAPAVVGLSPWSSPLSLWVDKTRMPDYEHADDMSEPMRWGHVLESAVAHEHARRLGLRLAASPGILAHPRLPWMRATPDFIVVDRARQPVELMEVKTASAFRSEEWADDAPPDHVVIQVLHQLAVTGDRRCHVAALVGGNQPRHWVIERDEPAIAMLIDREREFWDRVQRRIPPDPIGHDADADALAELYPGDPDTSTVLDEQLLAAAYEAAVHAAQASEHEQAARDLIDRVKAGLGDATEGLRPDGTTAVTWRPQTSTRLDGTRLKADDPDLWDRYATTSATRRFLIKKPKKGRRADAAA